MARKFLTAINLAQNALQNAQLQNLAGAPGSPVPGQVYFDTTLGQVGYWDGTIWIYGANAPQVATANGFAGTVATPGTTPVITLQTTVGGLLKGNGTGAVAAVPNTDYAPPASPVFTGTVTVPTPIAATAAATKGYVDATAQGLSVKPSAAAATTGAETYTVTAGAVTQISGTAVDGQSPNVNDYVLVKDAPAASGAGSPGSSQAANGLYQVTGNTTSLTLTRAAAMSGSNPPAGAYVFVEGGTVNAASGWVVSSPSTSATFTYGTTALQWTQFSGAGEITAGTGLSKSGNTLNVATGVGAGLLLKSAGATGVTAAKYTATIGDGSSTTITVTHNLGTRDVVVAVYDAASYVEYDCDVTRTSTSAVTFGFASAPAAASLNVVVIG